ncbi:MAG: hypothetical protein ACI8ZF_000737 [Candidatus Midichloriaceae bacterium]|jgi:hypothetical protein
MPGVPIKLLVETYPFEPDHVYTCVGSATFKERGLFSILHYNYII